MLRVEHPQEKKFNPFWAIYNAVLNQDIENITSLSNLEGIFLESKKGIYTPVKLLASEGESKSLSFLLDFVKDKPFYISLRDQIIEGYAIGGHITCLNEFKDINKDVAVRGFAIGGNDPQVEFLLKQNQASYCINLAVEGYAVAGNHKRVDDLLSRKLSFFAYEFALAGYAEGGHCHLAENLLKQYNDGSNNIHNYNETANGYSRGGHNTSLGILRILTLTRDDNIRQELVTQLSCYRAFQYKSKFFSLSKANFLRKRIDEYQLSFDQAYASSVTGLFYFLYHLFDSNHNSQVSLLPHEISLKIISFLLRCDLTYKDTVTLIDKISFNLNRLLLQENLTQYNKNHQRWKLFATCNQKNHEQIQAAKNFYIKVQKTSCQAGLFQTLLEEKFTKDKLLKDQNDNFAKILDRNITRVKKFL